MTSGQTVQATYTLTPATPSGLFQPGTVTATARYTRAGRTTVRWSVPEQVTTSPPVQATQDAGMFVTSASAGDPGESNLR